MKPRCQAQAGRRRREAHGALRFDPVGVQQQVPAGIHALHFARTRAEEKEARFVNLFVAETLRRPRAERAIATEDEREPRAVRIFHVSIRPGEHRGECLLRRSVDGQAREAEKRDEGEAREFHSAWKLHRVAGLPAAFAHASTSSRNASVLLMRLP